MALDRSSYADFLISELQRAAPGRFETERIAGNRLAVTFEQSGVTRRLRLLIFAIGGSGRSRSLERRVEITSTYAGGNLEPLSGYQDIVIGLEREARVLVGLDRRRLTTGGEAHNASTFIYIPSLNRLTMALYIVLQNERQRLFSSEYQIYMRSEFLSTYLFEEQTLHASGLRAIPSKHINDRLTADLDRFEAVGSKQRLDYDQQVQLALKKMQIGQLGEEIVLATECKRLKSHGLGALASQVNWVSQSQPFLGYDIVSFARSGNEEFVEVKSSIRSIKAFYFTANEMRQARRLGKAYRLLCVSNVLGTPTIQEFRDPIAAIARGKLSLETETYFVRIK